MKNILNVFSLLLLTMAAPVLSAELKRSQSCGSLHTAHGSSDDLTDKYSSEEGSNSSDLVPSVHFSWRHVQAYQKEYEKLLAEAENVDWTQYAITPSVKGQDSLSVKSGNNPMSVVTSKSLNTAVNVSQNFRSFEKQNIDYLNHDALPQDINFSNNCKKAREKERLILLRENFIQAKQKEPKSFVSKIIEHPYKAIIGGTCILATCAAFGFGIYSYFRKK
ncbi:hypothetical protein KAZ82_00605 [Candidatus Babeliales bacterium]|nr:hypothetical protein [Candidatus Babeliales bacterium]